MENELVNVSQSSIAQALATDYFCIYYVNVDDDRFIEYSASPEYRKLGLPTMGDDLITFARANFEEIIHPDDRERFLDCFAKENIIETLDHCGMFAMTFRMMFEGVPTYVYLKITRMIEEEAKHAVIGISEEYLPHLFESFTREEKTTVNRVQGTGLGLAITAKVVELMGGTISVKSTLGEGSEFTVELELELLEEDDLAEAGADLDVDLAGRRVLIVEDNAINAEIATMILEERGLSVDQAKNGQVGVDRVREMGEGYYDAVLMDIQMPVMNGYEATQAIRSLDGDYYKSLAIIAMSANAYDEDVQACLASGMNAHIAKPFNPDDLLKLLQAQLAQ